MVMIKSVSGSGTQDSGGRPLPESRLSQGPPSAPLRSIQRPQADPADASTLDMLGQSPLDQLHGGGMLPGEAGSAGEILGAIAGIVQLTQKLAMNAPMLVPPEITMWLQLLMEQGPQIVNQQQSGMGMMSSAVSSGMGAPPPQPMQPGAGAGMQQPTGASLGPAPMPPQPMQQPPQRPRPPM